MNNPFMVSGHVSPDCYCSREKEEQRLIDLINNSNNVVLMAPRRTGKTELIRHIFDNKEIKDNFLVFYIDVLYTSSLAEFVYALGQAIYRTLAPSNVRLAKGFMSVLKSVSGNFGFDAATMLPKFSISLGQIDCPEMTLEEIFSWIESNGKPCLIAIDEFQRIASYPEKHTEALLRTYIQKTTKSRFIFSGSERRILGRMFNSAEKPFYRSAEQFELGAIDKAVYVDYVRRMFSSGGKNVTSEAVGDVYDLFEGHIYYMQKVFNEAFMSMEENETFDRGDVPECVSRAVYSNDASFRDSLSAITLRQKELLYAIASEGHARNITSAAFIKKHFLSGSSVVQNAARYLLDNEIVYVKDGVYRVYDRFFDIWLRDRI